MSTMNVKIYLTTRALAIIVVVILAFTVAAKLGETWAFFVFLGVGVFVMDKIADHYRSKLNAKESQNTLVGIGDRADIPNRGDTGTGRPGPRD